MRSAVWLLLSMCFSFFVVNDVVAGVAVGDRIRVTQIGNAYVLGYLESADAAKLRVRTTDGSITLSIPIPQVSKVEASRGMHGQTLKGAVVGGAIGLMIGTFFVGVLEENRETSGENWVSFGASFALGGLAIGALIGSVNETEKWERVQLDDFDGVAPQTGGQ